MYQINADHNPSPEELREIGSIIAAEHGIIRMYLIGSRARGDNMIKCCIKH
jgi:predicted nucleotidyltransferase